MDSTTQLDAPLMRTLQQLLDHYFVRPGALPLFISGLVERKQKPSTLADEAPNIDVGDKSELDATAQPDRRPHLIHTGTKKSTDWCILCFYLPMYHIEPQPR